MSKTWITVDRFPGLQELDVQCENLRPMKGIRLYNLDMPEQLNLFSSYVEFSPEFYQLLVKLRKNHPPVDQQSLWNIDSALASYVYCWLQRRIQSPSLYKPRDLS